MENIIMLVFVAFIIWLIIGPVLYGMCLYKYGPRFSKIWIALVFAVGISGIISLITPLCGLMNVEVESKLPCMVG